VNRRIQTLINETKIFPFSRKQNSCRKTNLKKNPSVEKRRRIPLKP
jgi:hypothetical protein